MGSGHRRGHPTRERARVLEQSGDGKNLHLVRAVGGWALTTSAITATRVRPAGAPGQTTGAASRARRAPSRQRAAAAFPAGSWPIPPTGLPHRARDRAIQPRGLSERPCVLSRGHDELVPGPQQQRQPGRQPLAASASPSTRRRVTPLDLQPCPAAALRAFRCRARRRGRGRWPGTPAPACRPPVTSPEIDHHLVAARVPEPCRIATRRRLPCAVPRGGRVPDPAEHHVRDTLTACSAAAEANRSAWVRPLSVPPASACRAAPQCPGRTATRFQPIRRASNQETRPHPRS